MAFNNKTEAPRVLIKGYEPAAAGKVSGAPEVPSPKNGQASWIDALLLGDARPSEGIESLREFFYRVGMLEPVSVVLLLKLTAHPDSWVAKRKSHVANVSSHLPGMVTGQFKAPVWKAVWGTISCNPGNVCGGPPMTKVELSHASLPHIWALAVVSAHQCVRQNAGRTFQRQLKATFHPTYQTQKEQCYLMYKFLLFMVREAMPERSLPLYPPALVTRLGQWKSDVDELRYGRLLRDHLLQLQTARGWDLKTTLIECGAISSLETPDDRDDDEVRQDVVIKAHRSMINEDPQSLNSETQQDMVDGSLRDMDGDSLSWEREIEAEVKQEDQTPENEELIDPEDSIALAHSPAPELQIRPTPMLCMLVSHSTELDLRSAKKVRLSPSANDVDGVEVTAWL